MEVDRHFAEGDRHKAPYHGHHAPGNRQGEDHRHDDLLDHLEPHDQRPGAPDLEDVHRDDRHGIEEPRQADHLEIGHRGHPLLGQQHGEHVVRHGRQPQHHGEHDVGHDHHHLPVAFAQLRAVVADLRKGREGDALHGLHARDGGHILDLHGLVERPERRSRVHRAEKELRDLVVEVRNQVGGHQAASELRHFAQGAHREAAPGPPVAQPPEGGRTQPHAYDPLDDKAPDPPPGQRAADGRQPADERGEEGNLREQGEAELPDEDRVLHGAQGRQGQQQVEDRGDFGHGRHVVPPGREGRERHHRQIADHRNGHVEEENRPVVGARGVLAADEALREAPVDEHQQYRDDRRGDGHIAQDLAREQAQDHQAHGHREEHRADLLGHAPRHALRNLFLELRLRHGVVGLVLRFQRSLRREAISALRRRMLRTSAISTYEAPPSGPKLPPTIASRSSSSSLRYWSMNSRASTRKW